MKTVEAQALKEIARTRENVYKMKVRLAGQIADLFPVGSDITWQKGGNNLSGTVTALALNRFDSGIGVRSTLTEKTYWIDIYDVLLREGLV